MIINDLGDEEIKKKMKLDVDVSPPASILYHYAGNYVLT